MRDLATDVAVQTRSVPDRWCVHSYYTLDPWAPDGSGRLLLAGADRDADRAEVLILGPDGDVLDRFGDVKPTGSFWHTGLWQSWGPGAAHVYYQCGSLRQPRVARRELATGRTEVIEADLEGIPPTGEPGVSALHGLLYAAGYGDGEFRPEEAPVPFQARDRHGLSVVRFEPAETQLAISTAEMLERHPNRDRLREADRQLREKFGPGDGLTLMCYCVRWNRQGTRFLFYFGNHCVSRPRGEPRLASVWTADRDMKELHLAADFSFGRRGVHWGWHPDGERLIGYGAPPDGSDMGVATVHYTGADYQIVSKHASGGHPTVSPVDPDLLVTDSYDEGTGFLEFIDLRTDETILRQPFPRKHAGTPGGRHPGIIDLHPVFSPDGERVLINTLPGRHGTAMLVDAPRLR